MEKVQIRSNSALQQISKSSIGLSENTIKINYLLYVLQYEVKCIESLLAWRLTHTISLHTHLNCILCWCSLCVSAFQQHISALVSKKEAAWQQTALQPTMRAWQWTSTSNTRMLVMLDNERKKKCLYIGCLWDLIGQKRLGEHNQTQKWITPHVHSMLLPSYIISVQSIQWLFSLSTPLDLPCNSTPHLLCRINLSRRWDTP